MMLKNPTYTILQMFSFMLHPPHRPRTLKLHHTPMPAINLFTMLPVLLITIHYISASSGVALGFIVFGAGGQFGEAGVAGMR